MPDDGTFKTKLSTKGQVVLPKEIRRRRNWAAGAELIVEETPDGVLLRPAPTFPRSSIEDVYGCLRRPGVKPVSVEEMNEGVMAEARRRHARGRY